MLTVLVVIASALVIMLIAAVLNRRRDSVHFVPKVYGMSIDNVRLVPIDR